MDEYRLIYHKKLLLVLSICCGIFIVIIFFGQLMLELLIGHGSVTTENVRQLWWIMICLGGVFVGGAAGQISACSYYACGDTKSPTVISLITYTVNIPVKIIVYNFYSVVGLAVLMSVYFMIDLSCLFFYKYQFSKNE